MSCWNFILNTFIVDLQYLFNVVILLKSVFNLIFNYKLKIDLKTCIFKNQWAICIYINHLVFIVSDKSTANKQKYYYYIYSFKSFTINDIARFFIKLVLKIYMNSWHLVQTKLFLNCNLTGQPKEAGNFMLITTLIWLAGKIQEKPAVWGTEDQDPHRYCWITLL